MTSSPLSVPGSVTASPPYGTGAPQLGGLDPLPAPTQLWFIAICHRCAPDFGQPFAEEDERDDWAAEHATDTGHVVQLLAEVAHAELGGHTTAMLRWEDARGWWLCTAEPCERWNGPFVTAALAATSFRSHRKGHHA